MVLDFGSQNIYTKLNNCELTAEKSYSRLPGFSLVKMWKIQIQTKVLVVFWFPILIDTMVAFVFQLKNFGKLQIMRSQLQLHYSCGRNFRACDWFWILYTVMIEMIKVTKVQRHLQMTLI